MKKNLVKKAVLPALAALVCSVIALTSVSYAWFTIGDKATVEGVQMNVTAADGLQISATGNASDFKSTLDMDALKAVEDDEKKKLNNFPKGSVAPVSTVATVTNGQMTFYLGTLNNGVLEATEDTSKANVIYFDIYVKSSAKRDLILESISKVEKVNDKETYLASRVAFFDMGSHATAAGAQALSDVDGTAVIWEPNSTIRSTAYTNAVPEASRETGKVDYEGIKSVSGKTPSLEAVTTSDNATDLTLCEMEAGYNKIRVFIWLEGQDVDCLNEISGGSFKVTLNLKQGTVKQ